MVVDREVLKREREEMESNTAALRGQCFDIRRRYNAAVAGTVR